MAALAQEPLTFEDVAVYLSRAEWDAAAEAQRELYRSVLLDTYELLASLGYPGPKPDVLHRVERGEAPWVCAPQSPRRWDAPGGPGPGRGAGGSWLQGHVPEEREQTPDHGGRCTQWRLRTRRLLRKFGGGGAAAESGAQARTAGTQREAQDAGAGAAAGSGRLPLHPAAERRDAAAAPRPWLHGGPAEGFPSGAPETPGAAAFPQGSGAPSAEGRGEAVWKDHCYCAAGVVPPPPRAPRSLREHDYCGCGPRGVAALRDHQYCHPWRVLYCGRDGAGEVWAALRRLARRRSRIGRILRRAKRITRHCRGCGSQRRASPQGPSGAGRPSERAAVPPAAAQDDPTQAARAACCPAELEAAPPRSEGACRGGTSEGLCARTVSSAAAVGVKSEVMSAPLQAPGPQLLRSPGGQQSAEGRERVACADVSLQDACRVVLHTVGHVLDAVRQDFQLSGCSQRKELWPVLIRIDS